MMSDNERFDDGDLATKSKQQTDFAKPPLYALIMHNDDYTTMEFVVAVLTDILQHDLHTAYELMMFVHTTGNAVVGVFPKEIAEMKLDAINELATKNEFPLLTTLEKIVE